MAIVSLDILQALATLERRRVIVTDPNQRELCCGLARDDDGFCIQRPSHPVFVSVTVV